MNEPDWKGPLGEVFAEALGYLEGLPSRPLAGYPSLSELRTTLGGPLQEQPLEPREVVADLAAAAEPGVVASGSGRFFGFVVGGATPAALAADWLASTWDQNAGLYVLGPAASVVEEVAGEWLAELLGLPAGVSVGFVTGAQMANFTGLAIAVQGVLRRAGWELASDGLWGAPRVRILAGAAPSIGLCASSVSVLRPSWKSRPTTRVGCGRKRWRPRWATTFFAESGDAAGARACAAALATIAGDIGQDEAMSALSHALGETTLLDGSAEQTAGHFSRALMLLHGVDGPFDRLKSERRAAAVLAAAGRREEAVEHLIAAYRTARRLGAKPTVERVTGSLSALGEQAERRLGRRAISQAANGSLTRREVEVVRLVAMGHTSREIARELFLSPRTVETHVTSILLKLDCRSRAEAARRATELGLITG